LFLAASVDSVDASHQFFCNLIFFPGNDFCEPPGSVLPGTCSPSLLSPACTDNDDGTSEAWSCASSPNCGHPDLVIASVTTLTPTAPINTDLTFTVTIKNQGLGTFPSGGWLDGELDNSPCNTPGEFWASAIGFLDPGEVKPYIIAKIGGFPTPGDKTLWFFADADCFAEESAEWNNKQSFDVTITSDDPVISVTPASINFGDLVVGFTDDQVFNVKNTGGGTLSGTITGFSAPFSCITDPCTYNLPAGAIKAMTIRFAPTSPEFFSQTLFFSGAAGASRTVMGTGTPTGDTTFPTVSSVVPANLATGVSTGATVTVTFNEAMDPSTVTSSSFTLSTGGVLVAATVTGSGASFTLTPSSPLAGGTSYTVQVKGSAFCPSCVKDAAGNALATSFFSSFTTTTTGTVTATAVVIKFPNPIKATSFTGLTNDILNFLFTIAIILAPILLVIAGIIFMTAAGNPAKITTAKNMLLWTVVGFGIILLSKGLIGVLKGILGI